MWYVGSRTAKGCNPSDGYICSSRKVKPMIIENTSDWKREVISTGTVNDMIQLETLILQLSDAKNDPRSFNQHNGDGQFINKGGVPLTEQHKLNLGLSKKGRVAWNKGKKMSEEYCQKLSAGHTGKKRPAQNPESNLLRSMALRGRTPWNKEKQHKGEIQ
jgi:hypothetical protein